MFIVIIIALQPTIKQSPRGKKRIKYTKDCKLIMLFFSTNNAISGFLLKI